MEFGRVLDHIVIQGNCLGRAGIGVAPSIVPNSKTNVDQVIHPAKCRQGQMQLGVEESWKGS